MVAKKEMVALVCVRCGARYEVHPYRADSSRYCSKECWSDRAPYVECRHCGTTFKALSAKGRIYCSAKCMYAHRVGSNATRWIDGQSLERDRLRLGPELRRWRRAVLKRDRHRCRRCRSRENLHAHHVLGWADYPELRFVLANGLTLCHDCHSQVHGRQIGRPRPKSREARRSA